ncbi:MAG: LPS export ABC transporter periplasmic protein LptC [Porticoccaceae bacterium]|nr:LPS export ABC transporter periplasmic protein LptC [Porticoccaceae bacterium]
MGSRSELLPMIRQSFIIIIMLAIVSWFLIVWDSSPQSFLPVDKTKTTASDSIESYMTGVTSRRFSESGGELFLLSSTRMEVFSGSSSLKLSEPKFLSIIDASNEENKRASFAANWGFLSDDGTFFTLNGDVHAVITGSKNQSKIRSGLLNYDSKNMLISTNRPFTLSMSNSSISGGSLTVDLINEVFTVSERLKANYDAI